MATLGASMMAMVGNPTLSNKNHADHHEASKVLAMARIKEKMG